MGRKHIFSRAIVSVLLAALMVYLIFGCQIKTYMYRYQTDSLKERIEKMGCNTSEADEKINLAIDCNKLIKGHNEIVKKWAELKCVNKGIEELMPASSENGSGRYEVAWDEPVE